MQSFSGRRKETLDTSQPSVRHVQELIRHKIPVTIQVLTASEVYRGVIRWQDLHCIALSEGDDEDLPLTLINRETVSVIRVLS
jgi:host factor-I protein